MADRKLIQEWLQKADEDLGFASSIIEDSTFYAQICFHFQQAAEKYLKAIIVADDLEFHKIHDLLVLLKALFSTPARTNQLDAGLQAIEPLLHRHPLPGSLAY